MTPEQIAESIRQQLAQKERTDLDQLGRAQTVTLALSRCLHCTAEAINPADIVHYADCKFGHRPEDR